jgi:hypothetical protein
MPRAEVRRVARVATRSWESMVVGGMVEVGMGYGAIWGYLYVDGWVDDIVGRIHDAIWLEW